MDKFRNYVAPICQHYGTNCRSQDRVVCNIIDGNYEETNIITDSATNYIINRTEDDIVASASIAVGFKVDKEELIKALEYDRDQYSKGYDDGYEDAIQYGKPLGCWERYRDHWRCSVCKREKRFITDPKHNDDAIYCSHCGTKLLASISLTF